MLLCALLGILTAVSLGLMMWQFWAGMTHVKERTSHRVRLTAGPAVSVLKPLKGCDEHTRSCLRSWLTQAYAGPWEILFGVTDVRDPVCALVEDMIATHPHVRARLVLGGDAALPNPKVGKLDRLAREAAYEWLVVSDADVRVEPDFLERFVSTMIRPGVGLSFCLYRLAEPATAALRWEAVAINADFWSQVLQARGLGLDGFALGAVMGLGRAQLDSLGGFHVLGDYVADDFQLGWRVARSGCRVALASPIVECLEGRAGWKEVWLHQLRWARTIRFSRPGPYFLSILGNATCWPFFWWMATRWEGGAAWVGAACLGCLAARISTALLLQAKLTGRWDHATWWWMIPVKDILQAALWAVSFAGSDVVWKGERLRLGPEGKLFHVKAGMGRSTSIPRRDEETVARGPRTVGHEKG